MKAGLGMDEVPGVPPSPKRTRRGMLVGAEGLTPSSVAVVLPVSSPFDVALSALKASVPAGTPS